MTNHVKANGIHYTPTDLAEFVAEVTLRVLGERKGIVRVVDPACGDGGLLCALAKALPERRRSQIQITGFDTDATALGRAKRALAVCGIGRATLRVQDFLSVGRVHGNERLGRRFDVVIANPPYVRTQVLGAGKSRQLARRFQLSGRLDLYQAFVSAMANVLTADGVLGLVTSNRFLTVRAGESLRELLLREFTLNAIYDLGDTKLFAAAVLPAVVVATRRRAGPNSKSIFERVYQQRKVPGSKGSASRHRSVLDALRDGRCNGLVETAKGTFRVERGILSQGDGRPWTLSTPKMDAWLAGVRANQECSFSDVAKVRVGIKTTADDVFLRDDWEDLPVNIRPEREILRPLLTHEESGRWIAGEALRRKDVLYPHAVTSGKRMPIDLADYPRAAAYLRQHQARLRRRKYLIDSGREWYEI